MLKRDEKTKCGVDDFVLLEDYASENAFIENLRIRHESDIVYTYIGPVLISVNPYKPVDIYNDKYIHEYKNTHLFDLPPHVFAIADHSYRNMLRENRDECILISGESGAGKTEASKYVLEYIAHIASNYNSESSIAHVKKKLIQSNEILEAFGNARTIRNFNSSRFGKYMDIRFDYKGTPNGGCILNYLLEKSRVVKHARGERSFHIFYQLLAGSSDQDLEEIGLTRSKTDYKYLVEQEGSGDEPTVEYDDKDTENFKQVVEALTVCEFSEQDRKDLFKIIGALLHLGNISIGMEEKEKGAVSYYLLDETSKSSMEKFRSLLDIESSDSIKKSLTYRKFEIQDEKVDSPLTIDRVQYSRDTLAKDIYERAFNWIIKKVNVSLENSKDLEQGINSLNGNCVGILDIYGFEVFDNNGFEQLCINYCNEKLHELFIELTLKSEQEEYAQEGITWEPVPYTDNQIICDLIELRPLCIIDLLEEESLRPGEPTEKTLMDKMNKHLLANPHFESNLTSKKSFKNLQPDQFVIKHYAGNVKYSVNGFIDKNNNLLYRNLRELMFLSRNSVIKSIYSPNELNNADVRRTVGGTVASQFRTGLKKLMTILYAKQPSYIRCIKPNYLKKPGVFDVELVRHQVIYLSLLENLRVRRAGFAYKKTYDLFLPKYKCLCPNTWPNPKGLSPRESVALLLTYLGYTIDTEFSLGLSKIFIRSSKTFFELEDALDKKKEELASKIKALYKAYKQRIAFQKMKKAAIVIHKAARLFLTRRLLKRRIAARKVLNRFFVAYVKRNEPYGPVNKMFLNLMYERYLLKLRTQLPTHFKDTSWPPCPKPLVKTSELLKKLNQKNMLRRYCIKFTPEQKEMMDEKVLTSSIFKDRKESYEDSITVTFKTDRLTTSSFFAALPKPKQELLTTNKKFLIDPNEKIMYSTIVDKYDRHGYKPRKRVLIITDQRLYGLDLISVTVRDRISNSFINGVSVSKYADGLVVIHIARVESGSTDKTAYKKGDLIVKDEANHIEFVIKLLQVLKKEKDQGFLKIIDESSLSAGQNGYSLEHFLFSGEKKPIRYVKSEMNINMAKYTAHKDKKGVLVVEI